MDPIQFITIAPPEFVPWLILIALGVKAWQWYVLSRSDDDNTPATG